MFIKLILASPERQWSPVAQTVRVAVGQRVQAVGIDIDTPVEHIAGSHCSKISPELRLKLKRIACENGNKKQNIKLLLLLLFHSVLFRFNLVRIPPCICVSVGSAMFSVRLKVSYKLKCIQIEENTSVFSTIPLAATYMR